MIPWGTAVTGLESDANSGSQPATSPVGLSLELNVRFDPLAMSKQSSAKNPSWSRDELILALDLYAHFKGNPPGKASKEVVELSQLLNEMEIANRASDFRNANGVYMKVTNFRRFDPVYIAQGKKGLQRGGRLEQEVWDYFADNPSDLTKTAKTIRNIVKQRQIPIGDQDEDDDFAEAEEGRILTRLHRSRERSRELITKKKALALRLHGRLQCEACSFDFEDTYGSRGSGFIEAHHTKPLYSLTPGDTHGSRFSATLFKLSSDDTRTPTLVDD